LGESEEKRESKIVPVKLKTERLLLQIVERKDAPTIQLLVNDKEIARNTRTIEYPYPDGAAEEFIETQLKLFDEGKSYAFSICLNETNEMIGVIGLHISTENHNAELGYWVGRDYWSQGFCTEAAKPVIEFGFERLGLHRIYASHVSRNPASGKVLAKIGMTKEGVCRGHFRKWGVFEDIVLYGILATDPR
jgi:RimJ/RimL family protein N-acetyltransferase